MICPLLSDSLSVTLCKENKCAWWNEKKGKCTILLLSSFIDDVMFPPDLIQLESKHELVSSDKTKEEIKKLLEED